MLSDIYAYLFIPLLILVFFLGKSTNESIRTSRSIILIGILSLSSFFHFIYLFSTSLSNTVYLPQAMQIPFALVFNSKGYAALLKIAPFSYPLFQLILFLNGLLSIHYRRNTFKTVLYTLLTFPVTIMIIIYFLNQYFSG